MDVKNFVKILGADYFTGVPDSQLKALCNYLMQQYGVDAKHHVIGANEGLMVGLLSTTSHSSLCAHERNSLGINF